MVKKTTISIEEETRKILKKIRKYPRETYDETLKNMIKRQMEENKKKIKV